MRPACPEFEPLLLDRTAGLLDDVALRRLDVHLAGCDGCRAEAAVVERALSLAALPPAPPEERFAISRGAAETAGRSRAEVREQRFARRMALAVVASALFAMAVPTWLLTRQPARIPPADPAAAAVDWRLPDLDEAWLAAGVVDGPVDVSPDAADAADEAPPVLYAEMEEIDLDPE